MWCLLIKPYIEAKSLGNDLLFCRQLFVNGYFDRIKLDPCQRLPAFPKQLSCHLFYIYDI